MKSVIVGTAGHIDHGKTALVKALTGIDADRLEEEKRRGITIDIGFAHLELPSPHPGTPHEGRSGPPQLRLGFVDVPGHERFVRNMLAGIGGIDLVLLVIAADEGIKPQTREHFDICRLLQIRRGITVLTKSDLVDPESLAVVRLEVEEFLRGSFLDPATAPMVPVSALTGAGLDELRRELARVAADAPAKDSRALFRLPIDRVFTMRGFGTVVTGTLLAGTVKKEEEVEVFPSGRRVRIRGVQVHGAAAERAIAGERTALNLAGVATEDLARGMMLAAPGLLRATRTVDVQLSLLPSARPLKHRARVHFHGYTAETIAEVRLFSLAAPNDEPSRPAAGDPGTTTSLPPGATALAQLRLAEPALLLPGDRFILRQFSPVVTIGGGVIADAHPVRARRAPDPGPLLAWVGDSPRSEQLLLRIARRGPAGLPLADAVAETGWRPDETESLATSLADERRLVRAGAMLIAAGHFLAAAQSMAREVAEFHQRNPLVAGIGKEELRERLGLSPEIFSAVLDALLRSQKIEVAGEQVRAAGRTVVMKDEEAGAKQQIERAFAEAGLRVPALKEVLAALPVDRVRAHKIVTLLLRDRVLVKLADELVFHRDALADLRRRLAEYKQGAAKIDVARFKDLAGVSRKYAIPLLEYLDRERVTRRVGDEREIL